MLKALVGLLQHLLGRLGCVQLRLQPSHRFRMLQGRLALPGFTLGKLAAQRFHLLV